MKNTKSFPAQKLPMSKKTQAWKEACVDYVVGAGDSGFGGNGRSRSDEMLTYYDLYNSIYNEKDLKYVTNPFKQDDGFPAMALDYNIIKPYVDQLLGEETKRPFNFHPQRTSDIAASELQEKAKEMLMDYIQATIASKLSPEQAARYEQALATGEILTPEAIAKYLLKDYKDIAETEAYHALQFLKRKLNLTHEFYKGWKDALIGGEEIYYVGVINGDPYVERVNPMYFDYEHSLDLEFIDDAAWCRRKMIMSATEIYDRFYDKMSERQLNELLELIDQRPGAGNNPEIRKTSMDYESIKLHKINSFTDNPFDVDHITVYHCCWKSFKKIGFVTLLNPETGEAEEFQVDEDYKVTGTEQSVEWDWIIEVWEGYRIGDDMYIGIQPIEYQHISADNPNSQKLPYTGVVYNNTNSKPRSLVSMMKPLQYMYIVVWYRLELALSRDKGKVAVMDITLIPKSMNIDVNKWMHYLSALGVAFINPYDEGWDIPGREGGKPSQFNLLSSWDLTMSNVIAEYIQLMLKIEDMVAKLTGITPQRQGLIAASELVSNANTAVNMSYHITEPWFWNHNLVKRRVLTMLLNTSKAAWKDSKRYLNYILDDATRAFVQLSDNFFYEDMDIFVDDSTKNQQYIDQLKQLLQPAMLNGASLLDIAEIITLDNMSMIKNRLEEIEQKRMEQMQQQQQAEQQAQQQMAEQQNQLKEEELMLKEAELDLEKYKVDQDRYKAEQDNATKITVAQINSYRGAENMDQDMNGIPDPIEIGKQALELQKINSDIATKQLELNNKRREIEQKREAENKKIQLEKDRMKHETELQRMSDKAAMDREKLKAKTAIRNKVTGEK
ncbi:portal protein [uncultured phage cr6_1]|uniref:Portal protein n=1 Tax=uncultured phage cr6_1 TaxID=2772085 RepID=A0A7M1RRX3_9CAUD|nr:portal protein [uncultured phage cr6_1]QOR57195.1 portal protein [uncultured phage cr6_1]